MKNKSLPQFYKNINRLLLISVLVMIACFFTWSENVAITRAIKVVGRMGMLYASYSIYKKIIEAGAVDNLRYHNQFSLVFYLLYLLLGLASFMWSTNVGFSALQWFMTSQTLLFCYFFIKSLYLLDFYFPDHPIRLTNLLGTSSFLLILIFVVGMWVAPDVFFRMTHGGEEARLGGYLMNPNELGMLAGVGIAGLLFDLRRKHAMGWTIFKLLILFYGLMATGSRSSLIGVLLIIVFHVLQSKQKKIAVSVMILLALVAPYAIFEVVLKGGDPERMEEVLSMTGRLPFWSALIQEGLPREPLFGFGFMRIDYNEFFQGRHTYPGKMTHNTFMQVLMNLGFVGFTLVVFQITFTVKAIMSESKEKMLMLLCICIPIVINSFTEFGIFGESNYGILFYQLIILYVSFKPNKFLSKREKNFIRRKRSAFIQ